MKRLGFRVLTLALLAAMLLTACSGGGDYVETSAEEGSTGALSPEESLPAEEAESTAGDEETSVGEEETTGGESDPLADALVLSENGTTAYAVVIPSASATWEREAAERILARLGGDAAITDAAAPTQREIVIGYTNRGSALPADFFDVGVGGYGIRVVEKCVFIGANSATGMTAAVETLLSDIVERDGACYLAADYVCVAADDSTPTATPTLAGAYGPTVAYAQQMNGGVQAAYGDPVRRSMTMTNLNMALRVNMLTGGRCGIESLTNPYGVPYVTDTLDAYVQTRDGATYYSNDSSQAGRMNIYRYGSYYYESHVLGTDFGSARMEDPAGGVEPYDILAAAGRSFTGNSASCGLDRESGYLVMDLTSGLDPYVVLGGTYNVPTATYDALRLTVRTQYASVAQLYIAAGGAGGINSEQSLNFSVSPDGEFHTYILPLSQIPNYTGDITRIRLDFDGRDGEKIEISEVKAVKTVPTGVPAMAIDRTLHTYSDKLHHVFHLVTTDTVDNLVGYGTVTRVEASRVRGLLVIDRHGEHATLEGVDWDSAVCVGFDVANAGVFGYLLTTAAGNGELTVSLEDGIYVIRQHVASEGTLAAEQNLYVGQRIYTDTTHTFDGLRKVCREEQNPLTLTLTSSGTGVVAVGYEPLRGAYRINVDGTGFNEAFYDQPDAHYRADLRVQGDGDDRTVYAYTHTDHGELECAVLLDADEQVLPLPVQVCKNFWGEHEEPLFDKGDASYGEAYFPLYVKAGESVDVTVLNLYQNWGVYPLKQISSIQFVAPYYHLSTGVTETNCIAPYFVFGKDLWTLPDFRAMSAPMWDSQPQHTSAGQLRFLECTDSLGNYSASESTVDLLDSYGPIYSDITMDYLSDDGRIAASYRHVEMPQTDENRTYYEVNLTVLEDISFEDFKRDFTIFSMDGRFGFYDVLSYVDESGEVVQTAPNATRTPIYTRLSQTAPFVAYSSLQNSGNFVNMALLLKDWDIVLSGEPYTGAFVFSDAALEDGSGIRLNDFRLSLDVGAVTLKKGDTISIRMILLPWGSQLTPQYDISSVLQVRQDTCIDPLRVTATVGTVVEDAYVAKVRADGESAEFTLSGGENNMAVRVYGLSDYARPVIEEWVDGAWVAYHTESDHGYDGYTVYYDGDGTYSCAFIVPMDDGQPRTFRVTGN